VKDSYGVVLKEFIAINNHDLAMQPNDLINNIAKEHTNDFLDDCGKPNCRCKKYHVLMLGNKK